MSKVKRRVTATAMVAFGGALVIGCGDGAPEPRADPSAAATASATAPAIQSPAVTAGVPRGFRVDLRDQVHNARGLVKQPDGSYRAACVDGPEGSLRVRVAVPRAGAGGQTGGHR